MSIEAFNENRPIDWVLFESYKPHTGMDHTKLSKQPNVKMNPLNKKYLKYLNKLTLIKI